MRWAGLPPLLLLLCIAPPLLTCYPPTHTHSLLLPLPLPLPQGPRMWYKVVREIVTLERMHRAFAGGLMEVRAGGGGAGGRA